MKVFTVITATIFLAIPSLFGQKIEIGQDAESIKSIVELSTDEHDKADNFGNTSNSYWTWDVTYDNDIITEVVQCYENQYLDEIGTISYYCKRYIMQNGLLAYTLTEFEDLSLHKLKEYFENKYGDYKSEDIFFSEDNKYYSKIYKGDNGKTTVEWGKTVKPLNIHDDLDQKLFKKQETDQKNIQENDSILQKEMQIKSKTYDLEIHDTATYNLFIYKLRRSLIEELKYNYSPLDWEQIKNSDNKYFIFNNSYSARFKLVNFGKEIPDDGDMLKEVNYDFRSDNYFVNLAGEDSTCSLLKASPVLPTLNYLGYYVPTDALVKDIKVFYIKGITHVKIKKGVVTYFKYAPPLEVQQQVSENIKKLRNGKYIIKYEIGEVMDQPIATTDNDKIPTLAGKILTVTGAIILLTFYVLTLHSE